MQHIVFDHDGTLVDTVKTRELFPEIKELIDELGELSDLNLYVWTARDRASTIEFLKSLGIMSTFYNMCTSTDAEPKPVTDGLLDILPDNFNPKDVILIGDSYTDMIGAKKIGATAIGVTWGHSSIEQRETLTEFGADYIFDKVSELKRFINEWRN